MVFTYILLILDVKRKLDLKTVNLLIMLLVLTIITMTNSLTLIKLIVANSSFQYLYD